jgi:transcriptional regulator with XRE-family HTH domain
LDGLSERISAVIESLGMKKTAFAERLNVSQAFISQLCSGTKQPSDRTISDICREFNVSEEWLRTGEGEMFQPKSRNEELFEFAAKVAEGDPGSIQAQLLAVMSRLTDDQWEVLAQVAQEFVEETKKSGPQ